MGKDGWWDMTLHDHSLFSGHGDLTCWLSYGGLFWGLFKGLSWGAPSGAIQESCSGGSLFWKEQLGWYS